MIWHIKGYGRGLADGIAPDTGRRSWPGPMLGHENLQQGSTGSNTSTVESKTIWKYCIPEWDKYMRNASPENLCAAARICHDVEEWKLRYNQACHNRRVDAKDLSRLFYAQTRAINSGKGYEEVFGFSCVERVKLTVLTSDEVNNELEQ